MKNKYTMYIGIILSIALSCFSMNDIYNIEVKNISGESIKIKEFEGKLIMIVNTASRCGFTSQYSELEKIFNTYKDSGLVVLAFPSNNFMNQEPGSNDEIKQFCKLNYGISFPIFSKIDVKGKNQHPPFNFLTSKTTNPKHSGAVSWNFNKFLVNGAGSFEEHYLSGTEPDSMELKSAIEALLPTP